MADMETTTATPKAEATSTPAAAVAAETAATAPPAAAETGYDAEVKELYDIAAKLDASPTPENVELFARLLKTTPGRPSNRLLAQFIPKYSAHYKEKLDDAVNVLFDLCEDPDGATRIHAARGLPAMARAAPESAAKLSHVLVQLLQAEAPLEVSNVQNMLVDMLAAAGPRPVLEALFNNIVDGQELQRERALAFLRDRVVGSKAHLLDAASEEFFASQARRVMEDVTAAEFKVVMEMLFSLSRFSPSSPPAHTRELLDAVAAQMNLESDFDPSSAEAVLRASSVLSMAATVLFRLPAAARASVACNDFLKFAATKVLPAYARIPESSRLPILRSVADLCPFATAAEARALLSEVYAIFGSLVPSEQKKPEPVGAAAPAADIAAPAAETAPAASAEPAAAKAPEPEAETAKPVAQATAAKAVEAAPPMNYSYLECVLYAFVQLALKLPTELRGLCGVKVQTAQPNELAIVPDEAKYNEFRRKIKYVEDSVQGTVARLGKQQQQQSGLADIALRTSKSIHMMVVKMRMLPFVNPKGGRFEGQVYARIDFEPSWRQKPMAAAAPSPVRPHQQQQQKPQQQRAQQQQQQSARIKRQIPTAEAGQGKKQKPNPKLPQAMLADATRQAAASASGVGQLQPQPMPQRQEQQQQGVGKRRRHRGAKRS